MKIIIKSIVLLLFLSFSFILSPSVKAWFRVYPKTTIHIVDVAEPFYLDLLVPRSEAPLLSVGVLATLLPADYVSSPYAEVMNGYRDADGYASIRLYPPSSTYVEEIFAPSFAFVLDDRSPTTFKIILVFEDGSTHVSPLITQQRDVSVVTYDLISLGIQESDNEQMIITIPIEEAPPFRVFNNSILVITLIILAVLVVELAILYLLGYRTITSFVIVGLTHLGALGFGVGFFVLNGVFPSFPFALLYILIFSIWIIAESVWMPKWIIERKMERTMVFVFTSNMVSMLSLVVIYLGHFYETR
jgi:hypothetical protein